MASPVRQQRWFLTRVLLAFLLLGAAAAARAQPAPAVRIGTQTLIGVAEPGGGASFRGVAYARPPVGPLRWKPPQQLAPRAGRVDATAFGPACAQGDGNTRWYRRVAEAMGAGPARIQPPARIAEDCLYLNVWTPAPDPAAHLPVLLWIHGGSNENGYGHEPNYHGAVLARQGLVVVTINYRLGLFGFFAHPALGRDGSGRQGLLDQLAALRWVRAHIARFGGDPARITLAGESAGGTDVAALAALPGSRGHFAGAIIESGYLAPDGVTTLPAARRFARRLFGPAATAARLRRLSWQQIVALQEARLRGHFHTPVGVLPSALPVPLVIGSNSDEYRMYLPSDSDGLTAAQAGELKSLPPARAAKVAAWLAALGGDQAARVDALSSGKAFHCPSARLADGTARGGHPVFVYRFARVRPGPHGLGAYHGAEIPYAFGTADDWLPADTADTALSSQMQQRWAAFVRSGHPAAPGQPRWPRWNPSQPQLLVLGAGHATEAPPHAALCGLLQTSRD